MRNKFVGITLLAGLLAGGASAAAADDAKNGYAGKPRALLWNTQDVTYVDTTKYKKPGPYVIGFSNASISNSLARQHAPLSPEGRGR